ncbi:MAG: thiamine biosynthesis protein ThiS, partial [Clostridia bacterium]|nr:thiamine biosynthesis protein ThiS [Clostridia bacterium]
MKLWINGQEFDYADNLTLLEVLQQFAAKAPFAVMINQEF